MSYHSGNQLIDPYLLFEKAQMRPGMHVADLGCGKIGHIIFPASMIIGEKGVVYGVDILKDALEEVRKRAELENLLNVHTVWADLERVGYTAIPSDSLDVGFIINCLSQSKDHHSLLAESLRLLKDKARLVVVDWERRCGNLGPADELMVDFNDIKRWAREKGLFLQEEFSAGKYHKGLVFFKHD